ncbi:MAG: type III-A CRISPR-associated RAMP protein Csm4 [Bacilli bacterium]
MKIYKLKFINCGPITSIPDSQNFFGALAMALKSNLGKEELENYLDNLNNQKYQFLVSSFFFENTLPFPLDINPDNLASDAKLDDFKRIKKAKKIKFVSKGIFEDYQKNYLEFNKTYNQKIINQEYLLIQDNTLLIKKEEKDSFSYDAPYKSIVRTRNKVNYNDDTNLFYNRVTYLEKEVCFDCYLKVENDEILKDVVESLKKFEYLSIGGKRSIGINLFKFLEFKEVFFNSSNEKKVLLSKTVLNNNDIDYDLSYYKIAVLNNKFDLTSQRVYKKEITCMTEGSVFKTTKDVVGSLVPENGEKFIVYHNGLGFLV